MVIGLAFAAALAALTAPSDAAVTGRELWLGAGLLFLWGVTCLLAHWDVNRGRRTREWEIEDVPRSE